MAASHVRLLVIGAGSELSAAVVRALETSGIHVAAGVSSVPDPPSLDEADVVLVSDGDLLRDLIDTRAESGLPAIVVRSFDDSLAATLRESGAPGWAIAHPDSTADELAAAILAAARGFAAQPASQADSGGAVRGRDHAPVLERLTEREREVLALVSEGLPNKQVATRLRISEHTVKFHLSSIFSKLGVSSRTEAVRRGLRSGLIEL